MRGAFGLPASALRYTHRLTCMHTKAAFAVLLLLCEPVIAQHAASPTADPAILPSLAQAESLIGQGRLEAALKDLDQLAALQPEPAGVERARGFAFYQQGRMTEAQAAFHHAAAQDPADISAMQMEGVALFRMGKPADAIPLLERAHAAVPNANIDPNYVLGVCYLETRRYDDARQAFAAQYGFPGGSAPAYLLAARMFLRREYLPLAEGSARKALALSPGLPLAHQLLGEIALAQANFPAAIAELEKEQSINPLNGGLYDRLGDAYLRAGQLDQAQHALNRAVLLEPNSTGPYILLGKVLLKQENAVMATMYLERALSMDPSNYITHALLGQAYRAAGRRDDATREFKQAQQLQSAPTPNQAHAR